LRDIGHVFHNLVYISADSDRIFLKFLSQLYPWTGKSPLNFGSNPDTESGSGVCFWIRTPNPDHILLGGRMRSLTALVLGTAANCQGRSSGRVSAPLQTTRGLGQRRKLPKWGVWWTRCSGCRL